MKKICIYSLVIGIGLGIIGASIFNIVSIKYEPYYMNKNSLLLQETNKENYNDKIIKETITEIEKDIGNNKENPPNDLEDNEIYIRRGMTSEEIGEELEDLGIIVNKDKFNNLSKTLNKSRRFQYGIKSIPENSTMEEIIYILTR